MRIAPLKELFHHCVLRHCTEESDNSILEVGGWWFSLRIIQGASRNFRWYIPIWETG